METSFRELQIPGLLQRLRPGLFLMLFGAALAGCGSSGGGDNTITPPNPPPPTVPPVSSTPIDIEDGHRIGEVHWPRGNSSTGGQGQAIGTLECLNSQPVAYHVHTHLSIFLNGEQLAIALRAGFVEGTSNDCHYPLHTHDLSGLIHVHGTAPALFTLGQFFDIWGQSLSSTDVAGLTGMPVRVFVTDNGVATENTGDWRAIELSSHREITIQVGTDITEIPQYTWVGP